jgi:2-polyprenyl-3-methyl-5-hydroxy-6-metoxy-1,4-benzoquinol methylase
MRATARRAECDMWRDPAESFYAALYLDRFKHYFPAGAGLKVLDAGCQTGRLAIPLAARGHRVTGMDISPGWLELCRYHCAAAGVEVDLMLGDVREVTALFQPATFDAVICTELLYTLPRPQEILAGLAKLLKPSGMAVTSHRTRYYMLTTLARYRRLDDMAVVARCSEGTILGGQYFNWFDEDELLALYKQAGLRTVAVEGIGTLSGTGVDGLAVVLNPADLDDAERARLLHIERECAIRYRDVARYRLVVATPIVRD